MDTAGIEFVYEKPLTLEGKTRYPDFTIEDDISGRTVIWEHLGMLSNQGYRTAWEKKLEWYRRNNILPMDEDPEGDPSLVITSDSSQSGIDMREVSELISSIHGG